MPSKKVLEQKQQIVEQLVESIKSAQAGVLLDYRGLTVEQDTKLRNELRSAGVDYHVVKNSLTRFAVKEIGFDDLDSVLKGPTALALSNDPVAPSKVLVKFAKDNDVVSIKAGFIEGKVIGADEINALAKLPSKEELIAKLMGSLNSPASGLVNVLQANIRSLAQVLNAYADKKAAAGE